MQNIDSIDQKILSLLQSDSNLSVGEVADKVNLSQSPCWRRISRLKEEGYIKNKVILLDRQKLGLHSVVFVNIKLNAHGRNMLSEFEEAVVSFPEVVECWTITGGMDYSLRIITKDIQSYERFLRKYLLQLPHILEAKSHVGITEVKHTTQLPINR
jgi:Lrp/AsnC family transcriptional regulator